MKLDPELKAGWVADLRSGEFEQGHDYLRNTNDTYCCLGVLANRIDPGAWEWWESGWRWHGNVALLYQGGAALERYDQTTLTDMNDHQGCTFAQIADFIEKSDL